MASEIKLVDVSDGSHRPPLNSRVESLVIAILEFEGRGNTVSDITLSYHFFMLLKKSSLVQFDEHENKIFGYVVNVDCKLKNIDFVVS
ncbi:MAG: hypothetical protein K2Q45_10955 [Nitrosomonas sp.]|nr:hypothetical protein [Nitrosomonas sp.]